MGEIQGKMQTIMADIILLPKQPLPFDATYKVTPTSSAVTIAKPHISCQQSNNDFLVEKVGDLRTSLPPTSSLLLSLRDSF